MRKHSLAVRRVLTLSVGLAALVLSSTALDAAPVNGPWVVTNGNDIVTPGSANTNSPVLAPIAPDTSVSGNTLQSAFPTISLVNVGDYVELSGAFNLVRTANLTAANRLNDQLRIALLSASADPVAGTTTSNNGDPRGIIAEYGTGSPAGEIRTLIANQANPFSGGAATPVIGSAGADPEGNFLSGTPVTANFVLRLTRGASDTVDITGAFTGITVDETDNDYNQAFSLLAQPLPAGFSYSLNRAAFLVGGNADATEASLSNVQITSNVPEPSSLALLGLGGLACLRRRRQG